ncbi:MULTISPECIES: hypothetical protein [Microvirga]|uniref:hypothetical protein n=1 Tax=Microvirga TaxID=186650 RepID=UPI001CFEEE6D|nr:hypothetical protein [Microvirga lenta]MCB5174270.1 hypothetical protein [Microvirga lenta]
MLISGTLLALITSGLTLLFLSDAPAWVTQGAEMIVVLAIFVLVCLVETTGSRSDKSNAQ